MRVEKQEAYLVERLEIGPDSMVSLDFSGHHLAFIHQRLDGYLRRSDADPRQWIDPERMAAEIAFLMVEERLKGVRSRDACSIVLPLRSVDVLAAILRDDGPPPLRGPDVARVAEQTHERIEGALSMARH